MKYVSHTKQSMQQMQVNVLKIHAKPALQIIAGLFKSCAEVDAFGIEEVSTGRSLDRSGRDCVMYREACTSAKWHRLGDVPCGRDGVIYREACTSAKWHRLGDVPCGRDGVIYRVACTSAKWQKLRDVPYGMHRRSITKMIGFNPIKRRLAIGIIRPFCVPNGCNMLILWCVEFDEYMASVCANCYRYNHTIRMEQQTWRYSL
eukprot:184294_1